MLFGISTWFDALIVSCDWRIVGIVFLKKKESVPKK